MAEKPKAVLVAVRLPDVTEVEFDASLMELERLVSTLGYAVVARITQIRDTLAPSAVVGEGKLVELGELTGGTGRVESAVPKPRDKARKRREPTEADDDDVAEASDDDEEDAAASADEAPAKVQLVAVDHELSPSQARNLEGATGVQVLDRTGVIIEIFHRHARSREARLQVEIARLNYTVPRLRESPTGKERQRGRGSGEASLELDRRKVRDRVAELREELTRIQREQGVRRAQRREARRVALVGYTNAGKSSLMRALTGSEVYVEDKLFATLDTTVRALHPEAKPRILVSDTVGFIKRLPHDLVASFKSTLDEACEATLLLHIVDASDPDMPSQLEVTRDVLREIGAGDVPSRLVLNKVDRIDDATRDVLEQAFPDAWCVSAHKPDDVAWLRGRIVAFFEAGYRVAELVVPYNQQALVSEMHSTGRVESEEYHDDGVHVRWRADPDDLARMTARIA